MNQFSDSFDAVIDSILDGERFELIAFFFSFDFGSSFFFEKFEKIIIATIIGVNGSEFNEREIKVSQENLIEWLVVNRPSRLCKYVDLSFVQQ